MVVLGRVVFGEFIVVESFFRRKSLSIGDRGFVLYCGVFFFSLFWEGKMMMVGFFYRK